MPSNPSNLCAALMQSVRTHAPGLGQDVNLPLTIPQQRGEALPHGVHDIGGQPNGPLD